MTLSEDMNFIKQVLEKELKRKRAVKTKLKEYYIELTAEINEFERELSTIPDILQKGSLALEMALKDKFLTDSKLAEQNVELDRRFKENTALLTHIDNLEIQVDGLIKDSKQAQEDMKQAIDK